MKKSMLGMSLIIAGVTFGFFAIVSFVEIQANTAYFKTLPDGSSQPLPDYTSLYKCSALSAVMIASGIAVYLKGK